MEGGHTAGYDGLCGAPIPSLGTPLKHEHLDVVPNQKAPEPAHHFRVSWRFHT